MPQQTVRFEQFFAAPRERVFAWFADHEQFGLIWPGRTRRIQESADPREPNGLGSVREVATAGMALEETITGFEPPSCIEYQVTRGGPVKNHRGLLNFTAVDGGTKLDYTIEFDPKIPFTGGLIASVVCTSWHRGVQRAIEGLARQG
ncbi:MAG TPA: SRPBCC family protein [Verrucomicrobiae bacterium]|nr:SRPBCC family protein [Verrucomicrobiae bacterium]